MASETVKYQGIGLGGLLGVLFVALKLTGVIDWSWWLVTLPFWIGIPIALAFLVVMGFLALIAAIAAKILE
jgi:hypothetical protein